MCGDNKYCDFMFICVMFFREKSPQSVRTPSCPTSYVFCHRQGSQGRSTTFITPHGLTLVSQNLLPLSSTSSSRFGTVTSGSLSPEHGPSVVHCSAGIGRSGTFALVDTCLVLVRTGGGQHHQMQPTLKGNIT